MKKSSKVLSGLALILVLIMGSETCVAQDLQIPPGVDFTTGPKPGDVFKEYPFTENCWSFEPEKQFSVTIDDLKDAVRAEMAVENWGGHVGTSRQRIILNGNTSSPVHYPLPKNTPTRPECYHRTMYGNAATEFPLSLLKEGSNQIVFLEDEQICHGWDWPKTLTYALIFRIYYNNTKPHPVGEITSPVSGAAIGETTMLTTTAESKNSKVRMVHFIGEYEDFDFEGNGLFRQWHYTYMWGKMARTLGRATSSPHKIKWSTKSLPDQPGPMKIAAILTDQNGYRYMTPAVEGIVLKREIKVKMFRPKSIPENFSVRLGAEKSCEIELTEDITNASSVKLVLSTWSAKAEHNGKVEEPGTSLFLNGKKFLSQFGAYHAPALNFFDVPASFFEKGATSCTFAVQSDTKQHACEINIPGPILMATYGGKPRSRGPRIAGKLKGIELRASSKGFTYGVRTGDKYSFSIVDIRGRRLMHFSGKGPVHDSEIQIPSGQASGIVFGRLSAGNHKRVKKLMVKGR